MSVSQAGTFNVQEFTDAGIPLALGRLYTYANGTTTQKIAYTDAAGLVPHTYTLDSSDVPYIALNGRGELPAPLYLLTDGPYDLALKRPDGSSVWTRRAEGVAIASSIAALYAGSGGSALIGFLQAGTGAVARTAQGKMRDAVSPEDFGAVGNGVANDTAAFTAMVASGAKRMVGRGTYKVVALDLTSLPSGAVLDLSAATIRAVPTLSNPAVKMGGTAQTILIGDILSDTNPTGAVVTDGAAVLLESGFYCRYEIGQVLGFRSPVQVKPTRGFLGNNGLAWLTFRSKYLATDTGDCFYVLPNIGGGGVNTGYFTESDLYLGRLDGNRGIVVDANATQVADTSVRSNGLRFHAPSFEQITGDALVMVANSRNTVIEARYENVAGFYINEDANCARNCYDVGFGVRSDKLSLLGQLYRLNTQLSDSGGGVTSLIRWGMSGAGAGSYGLAEGFTLASNQSVCFKDSFSHVFRDRLEFKDEGGLKKSARLLGTDTSQTCNAVGGGSTIAVNVGVTTIMANSQAGTLTLTMPVEMENNGWPPLILNVTGFTSAISIKKSTGATTASAGITGTGVYLLVYVIDLWLISLAGAKLSA